jgi:hypothetical protein
MKLPLLAFTLALCPGAFAQAPSPDGAAAPSAPAVQPNTCVPGSEDCTLVPAHKPGEMDSATEGVLVGMAAPNTPSKDVPATAAAAAAVSAASQQRAQTIIASAALTPTPDKDPGYGDESGTDYAGIGSKILNPGAGAAPAAAPRAASNPNPVASRPNSSSGPGKIDASVPAPAAFTKTGGLSYVRTQKIEAAASGDRSTGLGALVNDFKAGASDAKLPAANEDLTPGGTRASGNQ